MIKSERNSAFELLRICAMGMIVFYHLVCYYLYELPNPEHIDFYTALLPTIHIGVILFVLISGYFGIRSTWKGLITLLSVVLIFNLPIVIYSGVRHGNWLERLMFLTNTPYWFWRTYLYLYLVAPLLSIVTQHWSMRERIGGLCALGLISIYFGSTEGDLSLIDGKNLVNFIFLYMLGDTLRYSESIWQKIKNRWLLLMWISLNLFIFLFLYFVNDGNVKDFMMNISFPYRSPILIINALMFFCMFGKLHFQNIVVNRLATSMFAVYILHCQPVLHNAVVLKVLRTSLSLPWGGVFDKLILLSISIMAVCILIDQSLSPYWKIQDKLLNKWLGKKGLYK